eukprot:gene23190-biopygen4293
MGGGHEHLFCSSGFHATPCCSVSSVQLRTTPHGSAQLRTTLRDAVRQRATMHDCARLCTALPNSVRLRTTLSGSTRLHLFQPDSTAARFRRASQAGRPGRAVGGGWAGLSGRPARPGLAGPAELHTSTRRVAPGQSYPAAKPTGPAAPQSSAWPRTVPSTPSCSVHNHHRRYGRGRGRGPCGACGLRPLRVGVGRVEADARLAVPQDTGRLCPAPARLRATPCDSASARLRLRATPHDSARLRTAPRDTARHRTTPRDSARLCMTLCDNARLRTTLCDYARLRTALSNSVRLRTTLSDCTRQSRAGAGDTRRPSWGGEWVTLGTRLVFHISLETPLGCTLGETTAPASGPRPLLWILSCGPRPVRVRCRFPLGVVRLRVAKMDVSTDRKKPGGP